MESAAHVSVLVGCLDSLPSVASFVWNIKKAFLNIGHKPWLSVYNLSWWPPALRPILSESRAAPSDHSAPQQSHDLLLARFLCERLQQQTPRRCFLSATKNSENKTFPPSPRRSILNPGCLCSAFKEGIVDFFSSSYCLHLPTCILAAT